MGNAAENEDFSILCRTKALGELDHNAPKWAIAYAIMQLAQAQHAANALTMEKIINNDRRYSIPPG